MGFNMSKVICPHCKAEYSVHLDSSQNRHITCKCCLREIDIPEDDRLSSSLPPEEAPADVPYPPSEWEYKVVDNYKGTASGLTEMLMDQAGKGWELVSTAAYGHHDMWTTDGRIAPFIVHYFRRKRIGGTAAGLSRGEIPARERSDTDAESKRHG